MVNNMYVILLMHFISQTHRGGLKRFPDAALRDIFSVFEIISSRSGFWSIYLIRSVFISPTSTDDWGWMGRRLRNTKQYRADR